MEAARRQGITRRQRHGVGESWPGHQHPTTRQQISACRFKHVVRCVVPLFCRSRDAVEKRAFEKPIRRVQDGRPQAAEQAVQAQRLLQHGSGRLVQGNELDFGLLHAGGEGGLDAVQRDDGVPEALGRQGADQVDEGVLQAPRCRTGSGWGP
jgi:hypothetical protein